ncbi:MAG: glucokinase [Rhabdochlamydiaceae bacterium]|nr:glucokinase [Rhabdochlamydiaceae bacterium]
MILAGDVGGTKVHLGLFNPSQQHIVMCEQKYKSRDYETFSSLLIDFLKDHPDVNIESACFGVAGPVHEGRCQATNLPWVIDAKKLSAEMKIPRVWLINDLEANAWGLRCLRREEFYYLNEGRGTEGNRALISAGTGLGEAGLYWNGKTYLPFACEGGHVDFAPRDEDEVELWRYFRAQHPHVSYERLLSGSGLYQIYRFLIDTKREKESAELAGLKEDKEPQRIIGEKAVARSCPACVRAAEIFCSIYGSEAGNLALKMFAVGGVYVGGGIAPKLMPILKSGEFMRSFLAKGRFDTLLSKIPVCVVLNENTALLGAAQYALEKN